MGWTIAIEELPSYQEGRHQGLDEGLRKGLDEGLRKGLEEGRLEGERRALRLLLETRFGPLPQWVDERLAGIGDEDELTRLFQRALAVGSLAELF